MILMVSPRRIIFVLAVGLLCLTVASLAGQIAKYLLGYGTLYGFVRLFDLNVEGNVPSWYASSMLLLCSILLALIAAAKKQEGAPFARHWGILSIIFLILSLDDAASFHNMADWPLRAVVNARGFLYFPWILPGIAFVLIFVVVYWRFLLALPRMTRYQFLVAGTLFAGAAIGMEIVGGYHGDFYGFKNMTHALLTTVEEVLEMLGIVVFLYALIAYMRSHLEEVQVRFFS